MSAALVRRRRKRGPRARQPAQPNAKFSPAGRRLYALIARGQRAPLVCGHEIKALISGPNFQYR